MSGAAVALAVALVGCEGGASADEKGAGAKAGGDAGVVKADAAAHPPVLQLVDDAKSTEGGRRVVVEVLTNDTFAEGGGAKGAPLLTALGQAEYVLTLDAKPRHGTAVLSGTRITYTPAASYMGEDDFTYKVRVKGTGVGAGVGSTPLEGTAVVRVTMNSAAAAPVRKKTSAAKVYFKNCSAARAAGAAPVRKGDPGYGRHLDRDGVGCGS
ncbi:excalibur calcium-binding domain-containing protein [Streptomyces sp. NPDC048442]|uniref:excalibur calcium-binding domain-containing protein n=1 Tax=Streptomyces sp. NPDC048442 TaxID=3154823 RepID=UPI003440C5E7